MQLYLWVGLGGFVGTVLRFWLSEAVASAWGETFPWGTLIINVTGSLFIGLFATLTATEGRLMLAPDIRTIVMIGICGGYTTFSSFSLQTLNLARAGDIVAAGWNCTLSFILCLLGVWLGFAVAQLINQFHGSLG